MTATLVLGLMSVLGAGAVQEPQDQRPDLAAVVRRVPAGVLFNVQHGELVGTDPTPSARAGIDRSPGQPSVKVVCGLTVVPVDPGATDPKMVVSRPSEDTTFTMRTVTPAMCWD